MATQRVKKIEVNHGSIWGDCFSLVVMHSLWEMLKFNKVHASRAYRKQADFSKIVSI